MLTLYGIPNCDSCRKARKWLDGAGVAYRFHDVRVDGVSEDLLDRWLTLTDWKTLLNTRSTTWRSLPDTEKQQLDRDKAATHMLNHPTLIKRPVAEFNNVIVVGFPTGGYTGFNA